MSSKSKEQQPGKGFRAENGVWRGRGAALAIAAAILLASAGAWIVVYTRSMETSQAPASPVDPSAQAPATNP